VKTFSHFFECVGPAEDQRQQPRIWLRGLAKVRAEFSLSARGYHLRRGLNLVSVADLLKALGVAVNRAAPSPACGTRPRFFMKANPPRSRKPWPDRNGPQFRRRVFKMVARASRPSNPAFRQISSAVVRCGLSAEIKPVAHLTTVLGGTPETTGRRPVPPI